MHKIVTSFVAISLLTQPLLHADESESKERMSEKHHIGYLMRSQDINEAISSYQEYKKKLGRHDFELLQQIATTILENHGRSPSPEERLLSLFSSSVAGMTLPIDRLEAGMLSGDPQMQLASIQYLGALQDDRADELLNRGMQSDFLMCRMEAAYHLAARKHRKATGQIEALMHRLPPDLRAYFPQFFALIGTSDAIGVLRKLMDDRNLSVRIEAILNAARYGRDDLLPTIRISSSHSNVAEQEACATALGALKDSKSIKKLEKLAQSQFEHVQLAANRSLYHLSEGDAKKRIIEKAEEKDLFAITLLGELTGTDETLISLLKDADIHVRVNAAIALLKRRNPQCIPAIYEILLRDSRDLAFTPIYSLGKSLTAWKVIASADQHAKDSFYDLHTLAILVREQILRECLELPEKEFLAVTKRLFETRQSELIPILVNLLENLQTPGAFAILEKYAQSAGYPLVRGYCSLSLLRMKRPGPYVDTLKSWIQAKKSTEMIRFRPLLPFNMRDQQLASSSFELTPEESSRLLIEAYGTLADQHHEEGIDIILEGIQQGNPKNRPVLAGLLIRAIQ
jgi:HEAT repeat protein